MMRLMPDSSHAANSLDAQVECTEVTFLVALSCKTPAQFMTASAPSSARTQSACSASFMFTTVISAQAKHFEPVVRTTPST
jgi:hypothetical protein